MPDPYNPISLDRYAYVNNNPVNGIDPSGHICVGSICIDTGSASPIPDSEPVNISPASTPTPPEWSRPTPSVIPVPQPYYLYVAPPDFNHLLPDGNPPPPSIKGLPGDKWEWGKWPGSEPGYKNGDDPTDSIWSPHEGGATPNGKEGEDPHWHQRVPGEKGRGKVYPENPGWGRGSNDRDHPGVYNPDTGRYEIIGGPSSSTLNWTTPAGVSLGTYLVYRVVKAIASPFICGPAAPACALAP